MGKASLAESFRLPPVQSPSRGSFPKRKELLHFHGFDASFDQRIQQVADSIIAEETPPDTWLGPAVEQCLKRRDLSRLSCARIRLTKVLGEAPAEDVGTAAAGGAQGATKADAKKLAAAAAALAEADANLAQLLVSALLPHCDIEAADIAVAREGGNLRCDFLLLDDSASVSMVVKALSDVGQNKKGFPELHEAFVEAGASAEAPVLVVPIWPAERVREELRLAFPQYDMPVEIIKKELRPIITRSWKDCHAAWAAAGSENPTDLEPLLAVESMAKFGGKLVATGRARRRGIAEDRPLQGASTLDELMADAREAQSALKEVLAEGSTWSKTQFNDPKRVPLASARRKWTSGSSDLAPNAVHFDPGVKDRHTAFEKAKRLQRAYEAEPALQEVFDCSRLTISFSSPVDMSEGVRRLLERLDVVWLENRFRSPTCLGHRDIVMGVQQLVTVHSDAIGPLNPLGAATASKRRHVSEVVLRLQGLHDAQEPNVLARLDELRDLLLGRMGVKPVHMDRCSDIVLRAMSCTDGVARAEAYRELVRVVRHYVRHLGTLKPEGLRLAELLADESADQALALGIDAALVVAALEDAPRLNDKRALRSRRVALVDELAQRLRDLAGLDFHIVLSGLLNDLPSLPHDAQGRVCLFEGWWEMSRFACVHDFWRGVSGDGRPSLQQECQRLVATAEAIAEEERVLLGASTKLGAELRAVAARSAAKELVEALLRFLLLRGAGRNPEPLAIAEAVQWAQAAGGASVETFGQVVVFLRWASFEDQICAALESVPSPKFMATLRATLEAGKAGAQGLKDEVQERVACTSRWQSVGMQNLCGRLRRREEKALPVAVLLLELGKAEVRGPVAEAMTGPDGSTGQGQWPLAVISSGALPWLCSMLQASKSDGKTLHLAVYALRYLAGSNHSLPAVSQAQLIPRVSALALDNKLGGDDVGWLALCILNSLAKASEADAEAIRGISGLIVDSVGRVKKRR